MPQSGSGARSAVRLMPAARALEAGGEHALACQRLRARASVGSRSPSGLQPPGELQWGGLHVADDDERSIVRTSYFQRLAFTYILAGTSKKIAGTSSSYYYRACPNVVSLAKKTSRPTHTSRTGEGGHLAPFDWRPRCIFNDTRPAPALRPTLKFRVVCGLRLAVGRSLRPPLIGRLLSKQSRALAPGK